jgi:hypothetical protein
VRPELGQLLGGRRVLRSDSVVTRIDAIEQTAPSMNEPNTQYGMPASVPPVISFWKTYSETLASVMPRPVKKLWVRKPRASCDLGSLSARNAR